MRQNYQEAHKNNLCLNKEKKALESDAMNRGKEFYHLAHDDEQQQHCSCSNNSSLATQGGNRNTWQVYTNTYIIVRLTAAYSTSIIYQVQVLCFETAYGV